jgi:hypothetical protein
VSQQTQVGLVSFSTAATVDPAGLTSDYSRISQATANLQAAGVQFIGKGMNAGNNLLLGDPSRQFNQKFMVLAVDGYQFVDEEGTQTADPETVAQQAAAQGIVIHTIGMGYNADETLLAQVAALTGGSFHAARDVTALPQVFQTVANLILASRTTVTILTQ